jgi:hypothetical protein
METGMDSSFTIKPPPGVGQSRALRDPVAIRGAVDTDLVGSKTVSTAGDSGDKDGGAKQDGQHGSRDQKPRPDHALQDLVADPNSRDVIYRERDVRAKDREHPDHALLRIRAYQPAVDDSATALSDDPHADIRA